MIIVVKDLILSEHNHNRSNLSWFTWQITRKEHFL